jgi:hypothetical protein
MTQVEALEAAKQNLRSRLKASQGLRVLESGPVKLIDYGDFTSSLLLIDEVWESVAKDSGDNLVVAIPGRSVIGFGLASDPSAVAALNRLATMPNEPYPVSSQVLQRQGKTWTTYKGPPI